MNQNRAVIDAKYTHFYCFPKYLNRSFAAFGLVGGGLGRIHGNTAQKNFYKPEIPKHATCSVGIKRRKLLTQTEILKNNSCSNRNEVCKNLCKWKTL